MNNKNKNGKYDNNKINFVCFKIECYYNSRRLIITLICLLQSRILKCIEYLARYSPNIEVRSSLRPT